MVHPLKGLVTHMQHGCWRIFTSRSLPLTVSDEVGKKSSNRKDICVVHPSKTDNKPEHWSLPVSHPALPTSPQQEMIVFVHLRMCDHNIYPAFPCPDLSTWECRQVWGQVGPQCLIAFFSLLSTVETGVGTAAAFLISGWGLCNTHTQTKQLELKF